MSVGMYGTMGGVLGQVMEPCPVIGGVGQVATGLYAAVGGVQRAVWPGLPAPGRALEAYTWEEIAQVAAAGRAREYWAVGDEKQAVIGGAAGAVQILGFDHDDLDSSDVMCATGYNGGVGKAAMTLQMLDCYGTTQQMNKTQTNEGGWRSCDMRINVLPMIKEGMDGVLQSVLRTVTKLTSVGYRYPYIESTADQMFLLSEFEVYGTTANSYPGEGVQYAYYANGGSRTKHRDGKSSTYWWLRSPLYGNAFGFVSIRSAAGESSREAADTAISVAAAFCI